MLAVKDNKTPLIDRLIDLGSDVCARNNVSSIIFANIFINFPHKMTSLFLGPIMNVTQCR